MLIYLCKSKNKDMATQPVKLLPLPEASIREPDEVLARYQAMLNYDIPGFVVRQSSLNEIASIILPTGLVYPSSYNGTNGIDPASHESTDAIGEDTRDFDFHVHGLPEEDEPDTILHHLGTKGSHIHSMAEFSDRFVQSVRGQLTPEERFERITSVSNHAERTLRNGRVNPAIFQPHVYQGRVDQEDVTINRIAGKRPTTHDYRTVHEPGLPNSRTATVRGYTATGVSAK
jgi:hypothetical protein